MKADQQAWQEKQDTYKPPGSDWDNFVSGFKYGFKKTGDILQPILDTVTPGVGEIVGGISNAANKLMGQGIRIKQGKRVFYL